VTFKKGQVEFVVTSVMRQDFLVLIVKMIRIDVHLSPRNKTVYALLEPSSNQSINQTIL